MKDLEIYKKVAKDRLSEKRYNHSVSVANYAEKLAQNYGADKTKAAIAGTLHDITKEISEQEHLKIIKDENINLSDVEINSPKLLHSISGSIFIKNNLNIVDTDIINAVRYHTTARANMSVLEKIIFVADFISDDRTWDNVEILKELAFKNLDDAVIYGLKITIPELLNNGALIAKNTLKAYNDIMLKNKKF